MSDREIVSLWVTRRSIDAGMHPPELLMAWDEYTIDENAEGWFKACQDALAAMGNDVDQFRYVTVCVPAKSIEDAFFATTTVKGAVLSAGQDGEQ